MDAVSRSRAHPARKITGSVAVLVTALAALVALAPSAFAHHANIQAAAVCGPSGDYTVSYDSWSWVSTDGFSDTGVAEAVWRGQNSNIEISYTLNGGSKVVVENGAYALSPTINKVAGGGAHPFPVVSGSFAFRAPRPARWS